MTATIAARVELDSAAAKEGFKELENVGKSSFTEINSAIELAQKAFGAISGAIGFAYENAKAWAEASAESERQQSRLSALLGDQTARIQEFNAELSRKIGLDDDDAAGIEAKLLALGVLPGQLERATKATLGYAEATGKDALAATKTVAKAFAEGGAEAKRLEELFVLSEVSAGTYSGALKRIDTNLGEMQESLGAAITQSSGLREGLSAVADAAGDFAEIMDSDEFKLAFDSLARTALGWASDMINAFLGAREMALSFREAVQGDGDAPVTIAIDEAGNEIAGAEDVLSGVRSKAPAAIAALQSLADKFAAAAAGGARLVDTAADAEGADVDLGGGKRKKPKASKPGELSLEAESILSDAQFDLEAEEELRANMLSLQEQANQAERDLQAAHDAEMASMNEQRFQGELAAFDARAKLLEKQDQDLAKFLSGQVTAAASGIGAFVGTLAGGMIKGGVQVEAAAAKLFGGMLSQLGSALMSLGAAVIAAGIAGTAAPLFGAILGGPAAIAAGSGLVIAGSALAGVGSAIASAGAGGGASGASAPSSSVPSSFGSAEVRGFRDEREREPKNTTININLNEGLLFGTPRELGTRIGEVLRDASSLDPTGA